MNVSTQTENNAERELPNERLQGSFVGDRDASARPIDNKNAKEPQKHDKRFLPKFQKRSPLYILGGYSYYFRDFVYDLPSYARNFVMRKN